MKDNKIRYGSGRVWESEQERREWFERFAKQQVSPIVWDTYVQHQRRESLGQRFTNLLVKTIKRITS